MKALNGDVITVVSGLPRSGTSMMMSMLEAGGLEVLTDNLRTADDDNPKGYFEFERVKKLADGDHDWLEEAKGRVVKIISWLTPHLPAAYTFRIIFMRRHLDEVLASQQQMLVRRNETIDPTESEELLTLYPRHLEQVERWMSTQPNVQVLYVHYNELLNSPKEHAERVATFLDRPMDVGRMTSVVDRALHRQRAP